MDDADIRSDDDGVVVPEEAVAVAERRTGIQGKQLSVDESMIKFKGRIFFRQFLPLKPILFGIKQFCLTEAKSGYPLKFLIYYTGKETFSSVQTVGDFSVTEQVNRSDKVSAIAGPCALVEKKPVTMGHTERMKPAAVQDYATNMADAQKGKSLNT
ncbi:hypothetical protein ACOMHN_065521 [Nucella lapillus]